MVHDPLLAAILGLFDLVGVMRALGYVRVSTQDQADSGASLESQRSAIKSEVSRRGWDLVEIITDTASAKSLERPGIESALLRLRDGDAGALIVAKLDRLSRSVADFSRTMVQAEREGWELVSLDCQVDTTQPSGKLLRGILSQFAEFERELISQRTKDGLAARRASGVVLGRPRSVPEGICERIRTQRANGFTYAQIAAELNAENVPTGHGGRQWWTSTVRKAERRA